MTTKKKKELYQNTTYNSIIFKNKDKAYQGVFISTPSTGNVRMEWAMARYSQIIPCNWSYKQTINWVPDCAPIGYLVAEAQNLAVAKFMEEDCDWMLFIEHDNVLPGDCFLRLNEYVTSKKYPIVSGLYFTKTYPSEPLVYRGRGNGYYTDWKIGDKVMVDAIPMGCALIHRSIIETLWKESEEYVAGGIPTRRVFITPQSALYDPKEGWDISQGTSDMEFCARVKVEGILEKAGWKKFAKMKYPYLIDTNIFVGHINPSGVMFPSQEEKDFWTLSPKKREGKYGRVR